MPAITKSLKEAYLCIDMPYEPRISVNRIHYRGNKRMTYVPQAKKWLKSLSEQAVEQICTRKPPEGEVRLDVSLFRLSAKGRKPDTSNFRKAPQDTIAEVFGVDDDRFFGTDHAACIGKSDCIRLELWWSYWSNPNSSLQISRMLSSQAYAGPIPTSLYKNFGIKPGELCVGYGSLYCIKCSVECDFLFKPDVYVDIPCLKCSKEICPCKSGAYNEQIKKWWEEKSNA